QSNTCSILADMSTLRSGLEELREEDLLYRSDEELEGDLVELERAAGALEAEWARRVTEVERRGSYRREGYLSVSSWLAHRLRLAFSDAVRRLRAARALEHMPETAEALREGEISRSAVATLVSARETNPEEFSHSEGVLVDSARSLSIRDLRRARPYRRQAGDPDLASRGGGAGRTSGLDEAGVITPESARRLACDASITRVITRGPSEPLEVGRRTPVVPPALRRAVVVRDRHCRYPGCDRPQSWC